MAFEGAREGGPNNPILGVARNSALYVFCLCAEKDLLSQWRAYGKSGTGVGVGFDRLKLHSLKLDDCCAVRLPTVFPVIYSENEQSAIIDSVIEIVKDIFHRLAPDADRQEFWQCVASVLTWTSFHFKNAAFFEEQEWRTLWMSVPETRARFRAGSNGLIPYTPIAFPRPTVTRIVQGPMLDPAIGEGALQWFLDAEGYTNVLIDRSQIPLRAL